MARWTRLRVSSCTLGWLLSTLETVWWETPASRATSRSTAGRGASLLMPSLLQRVNGNIISRVPGTALTRMAVPRSRGRGLLGGRRERPQDRRSTSRSSAPSRKTGLADPDQHLARLPVRPGAVRHGDEPGGLPARRVVPVEDVLPVVRIVPYAARHQAQHAVET